MTAASTALRDRALALALALLAILARWPHLDWGLPEIEEEALPMKKALEMWGWGTGGLTLDPQTAGWPSLSFYVHLVVQKAWYAWGRLTGTFSDPYDLYVSYTMDPTALTVVSRTVGVVAAGILVYVAVRVAERLAGRIGAVLTGGLLVLSPMLIAQSQMVTPDILLTMFAGLCVARIVAIHEDGRPRDYVWAGIWAGLGAASKYTPVFFTVSLYLVHLQRLRGEGRSLRAAGFDDRRLGYAALASVLAFCVASPYTFADLEVVRRDFAYQALHMREGHFGHEDRGFALWYYLKDVLRPALGWPGLVAGLAGLGVAATRRRGPWLALVWCVVPFTAVMGSLSTQFDRYMLPMLFPLALGAAGAWVVLRDQPWMRARPIVATLLTLALLVLPARGALRHHTLQGAPSTQQLAKAWILENHPADTTLLTMEIYAPQLPMDERDTVRQSAVFPHLSTEQRERLLERPFYRFQYIPLYSARSHMAAIYYDLRHLLPYDLIVTSGAVRKRYERQPDRFPEQNRFYADLERFARLEKVFKAEGQSRGPEIRIYRFDDAGKQALIAERGPVLPGFYTEYADRIHAPHFFAFVDAIATHALLRDRFQLAELYYGTLQQTQPERNPAVEEQLAFVKLKLGKFAESEQLYRRVLQANPRSIVALGNLGYLAEESGSVAEARRWYEQCIRVAGSGPQADWARERLAGLDARE